MVRVALSAVLLISAPAWADVDPLTGRWRPGIGDPTLMGWFTVLFYMTASVLCVLNARSAHRSNLNDRFWLLMAAILGALALNKQLDLQSWFTQVGRDMAIAQGWYEIRGRDQVIFIGALCAGAIAVVVGLRRWLAASWASYRLTCVGLVLVLTFIISRAATFHHVDSLLGMNFGVLRLNHVLELGAITVVVAGAWRWRQAHRSTLLRELRSR